PGRSPLWLALVATIVAGALAIHFRERVAFAALIALAICIMRYSGLINRWPESRVLAFLGRISFSVFLIHYPVSMLMNAAVQPLFGDDPVANIGGLVLTWLLSVAAGAVFYRHVESRIGAAPRSHGTSGRGRNGRDDNRIIATY
ncbi:MAG TPA: acyltransferase family protein, partial [Methyloversatilis sp.]